MVFKTSTQTKERTWRLWKRFS